MRSSSARARAAEAHEREAKERGQELAAEAAKRAQRDIEAATQTGARTTSARRSPT